MKLFFQCLFVSLILLTFCDVGANAQDSTAAKKPEQAKTAPTRNEAVKTPATKLPGVKPAIHYVRKAAPAPVNPQVPPLSPAADSAQKAQMDPSQLNDKSLNGQYQYLLTKVYHYQQPLLAALWKNAMDTLNASRNNLKEAQAKLGSQSKAVDSLKTTMTNKDQSLSESNAKADAISVFGVMVSKSNYNVIMFCLVGGLAVALIIVIITTAKHKHEAKYRTELYEEIEEEYKTFKAKAHEKELKLARELQTERNKLDDLLGKS